jgi:hypothetical protein
VIGVLVLAGCGRSSPSGHPGGPAAYTSPVKTPLPFDSEENAFVGDPDVKGRGRRPTGCLWETFPLDKKSLEVCDCAYRRLRADGYPASELAASGSAISYSSGENPKWLNETINECSADLDPNKSIFP